jgi:bifunctional DNA-binding transcriptional regulator/antitoxin component of YhaV-PrlF toxin-antitoxin module
MDKQQKTFITRITGRRRQVTVPDEVLHHINASAGEVYLRWTIEDKRLIRTDILKLHPVAEIGSEVRSDVETSDEHIRSGAVETVIDPLGEFSRSGGRQMFMAAITAPRRQLTFPQGLLEILALRVGDFISWTLESQAGISTGFQRLLPVTVIPDEVKRDAVASLQQIEAGEFQLLDSPNALESLGVGQSDKKTG